MKNIFKKIALWLLLSIIICIIIYLISSIIQASFDIRDWGFIGRFFTGFIIAIAICVTGDEVSDLDLEE